MEANEMQPGPGNQGGQALEEFQRTHDEMGGAFAVGRFELEDDLAGRGAAESFVVKCWPGDVAAQAFEFLPLVGPHCVLACKLNPWTLTQP